MLGTVGRLRPVSRAVRVRMLAAWARDWAAAWACPGLAGQDPPAPRAGRGGIEDSE